MSGVEQDRPEDPKSSIVDLLNELRELREATDAALTEWVAKRRQTICQLEQLADSLQKATIATATGAGVATASFGLVLGGFIASFFTFGAGLVVSAVGAGLGAAGGLTMTGSKIVEYILSRLQSEEVQSALDEDRDASEALRNSFEDLDRFFARIIHEYARDPTFLRAFAVSGMNPGLVDAPQGHQEQEMKGGAARVLRALGAGFTVSTTTSNAAVSAGRAVFTSLNTAARAAHIMGFAASAALLPLDIYTLVKSSIELHEGSTSEIVTKIREDLASLSCPSDEEVKELVPQYVKDKFVELLNTSGPEDSASGETD